jgi:hypothetical protein
MGYAWLMLSLVQFGHAAVVAAALLTSSSPTARSRQTDGHSGEAREFERIVDLMAPLAKAVLDSSDREELEASLEEQLFSGLFSDLVVKSFEALAWRDEPTVSDAPYDQFLAAIEALGGDRSQLSRALRLSQISTRLAGSMVRAVLVDEGVEFEPLRADLSEFSYENFLYDIEIPVEIRASAHADGESAICMITLAYSVATGAQPPQWLITELVERWLAGQTTSLPVLVAMGRERGLAPAELLTDELVKELELFLREASVPDLQAAQERANATAAQMRIILEHAGRQVDGEWPKS